MTTNTHLWNTYHVKKQSINVAENRDLGACLQKYFFRPKPSKASENALMQNEMYLFSSSRWFSVALSNCEDIGQNKKHLCPTSSFAVAC